ncbi:MAG: helix-turn-helix domain-containing protein [Candidatus Woesearchaeota archaeon]
MTHKIDTIKETLKRLGMTKNEIEIYMTLLNSGELSVNEIGSKSGLHRQVCYDALDRLLDKGFVSFILKNSKKYFKPLNPEKILDYLDEKKDEINSILPELNNIYMKDSEETNVEVIKGKNVLRTIYNDIIKTIKEIKHIKKNNHNDMLAMGIEETKFLEFDEIGIKQYIDRLKKNKLKEKLLAKESATVFFEGSQSEYRLIPDHMFNPNPTHIYGDKIAIMIWGTPTYGIIIKNKQIADANRKYFQMLWKIAKKRMINI